MHLPIEDERRLSLVADAGVEVIDDRFEGQARAIVSRPADASVFRPLQQ